MNAIHFEIVNSDGYDVNRLPDGVTGEKSLMMWKELCRTGKFTDADGDKHTIDRKFLQNIVKTFFERQRKGVEIPCPVGHTHDPEAKRGRVVYLELRESGENVSLYGIIEFISDEAKEILKHSNVSIEAPEIVRDGDGAKYHFALEHVAFTDYPVVAGLDEFKDVVFSIIKEDEKMPKKRFSEEEEKKLSRCNKKLAEDAKEKVDEEEDDAELSDEEEEKKEKALSKKKKRCAADEEDENDDAEFENDEDPLEVEDDAYKDDDEEDKKLSKKKKLSFAMHRQFGKLIKQNRDMQIKELVRDGRINPKQAKYMRDRFCSEPGIRFSIENDTSEDFDEVIKLMKMNSAVSYEEETGVQFSFNNAEDEGMRAMASEFANRYNKEIK